jgi:hypothetical protein
MWKAIAVCLITVCGFGLSGLVDPDALGADAVDHERVMAEALTSLVGQDYDADITPLECTMRGADLTLNIRRRLKPWPDDT